MKKSEINRWLLSAVLLAVSALTGCSNEGPPRVIEADPLNPEASLLGSATLDGISFGMFVSDYIAYIRIFETNGTNSLMLFDITDINFPLFLNKFTGLESGVRVRSRGQFEPAGTVLPASSSQVYLPSSRDGLRTLDVSDVFNIIDLGLTAPIPATGSTVDYTASEFFNCVSNTENLLMIKNPFGPGGGFWVGQISSTESIAAVSSDANYCYYIEIPDAGANPSRLHIIDPGGTNLPFEVGAVDLEGTELIVKGDYAYVLRGAIGFTIIDVGTPASPAIISQISIPAAANTLNAMSVDDVLKRVYVATETGVSIFDVSDPFFPVDIGGFELDDRASVIFANNGILYMTVTDVTGFNPSQLFVIDVSQF